MSLAFKVKLCYVVFILLLIVGVATYVSGFILWFMLPRGRVRGILLTENIFLGLSRSSWENIHIVLALILLILIFIHLVLNWSWIKNVTRFLIATQSSK